jgi:hypothetical protein
LENSNVIANDTAVAYSFNRSEAEEGVENSSHFQINSGVGAPLTSTGLNAASDVMNTNFQVISNSLQVHTFVV